VRLLVRNAGSTVLTVLALALGIGINTAGFTAYKAMVDRPLDARAPTEMVNLALMRDSSATNYTFSYPDYEAYRDCRPVTECLGCQTALTHGRYPP
jgi:hypothetical protein